VAVASAGPYASLHLAADRKPRQHPVTQFLQLQFLVKLLVLTTFKQLS